ncbi:putative protein [BD1-7 clade bacterium]|uniref:Metallo-beta-lactamase domain-containing protein n=1 Tax=BD1-7 clade bacterium TaxID=2029982 RepID=A0A5S9PBU8_9GAMM|nr:putative protein [BD1-7 clade bacterium]
MAGATVSAANMTAEQGQQKMNAYEKQPAQFYDGQYHNPTPQQAQNSFMTKMRSLAFNKSDRSVPDVALPITQTPIGALSTISETLRFVKLGHSSLLIDLAGKRFLIDPVFSERASPVQWIGPKRFHSLPLDPTQLLHIDAVVISHSHYDHLDKTSILDLQSRTRLFIVPQGVGEILTDWGIPAEQVVEKNWWQSAYVGDVELVATPAQHFSGRGLLDRDETLWASWVLKSANQRIFFSGDSGYFPGFKAIGEAHGPFDVAFIEAGAYNPAWRDMHMMPEDSIQAFQDVNANLMVPIHNGTFDLSIHAWMDPMEQISQLAQSQQIDYLLPMVGDIIDPCQLPAQVTWWRLDDCSGDQSFTCTDSL